MTVENVLRHNDKRKTAQISNTVINKQRQVLRNQLNVARLLGGLLNSSRVGTIMLSGSLNQVFAVPTSTFLFLLFLFGTRTLAVSMETRGGTWLPIVTRLPARGCARLWPRGPLATDVNFSRPG